MQCGYGVLFNVSEEMSLSVNPSGILHSGSTIVVTCMIRFSGPPPGELSSEQDPVLEMTLDNEAGFPTGQLYVQFPAGEVSYYRKNMVIIFCMF